MIVTDKFVFLHNLRTGGTFLRYVLRDNGVRFQKFPLKHEAWRELTDPKDREKPVVIFVRNPWDWAVSIYSFENQVIPGQNDWAKGTFEEVVRGKLSSHQDYFEHFTRGVPEHQLHVGRFENLKEDAVRIFEELDCPNMGPVRARILRGNRIHNSLHAHYREYYTPELRDYVAKQNERLIERFGYTF